MATKKGSRRVHSTVILMGFAKEQGTVCWCEIVRAHWKAIDLVAWKEFSMEYVKVE